MIIHNQVLKYVFDNETNTNDTIYANIFVELTKVQNLSCTDVMLSEES